ncbi:hypothetical protein IV102_00030 [bacterium]|nr:hypothetical protein [bacterium]
MTLTSINQARPFVAASAARASAPAEQSAPSGDSFTLSNNQPPAQQPPAQQPPAQQPPAQQPPAQQQPPTQPQPPQQPPAPPQPELKEWTVLVYSVSDNNLYSYMQEDLNEAERVGSTEQMTVLAETSHQPRGGSVVRMKLETNDTPGLTSPVLTDLGKTHDMAKSDSMADAIAWAMKEYPSKHFAVVVSDHGGGWQGANHSESTDSWMNVSDLEAGFKKAQELTGKKVDVIGFDECLMASTEVAHALQGCADYMVASEEVEGGAGWQYDQSLGGAKSSNSNSRVLSGKMLNFAATALRSRDPLTPESFAKGIVQMAEGHQRDLGTMSALDLNKFGAVSAAVDNFAGVVLDSNLGKADFAPVAAATQKFYRFADLGHFVDLASTRFGGAIAEAGAGVKQAMSEAVVANQHSTKYPNAQGLNIELNKQAAFVEQGPADVPNLEPRDKDRMNMAPYKDQKFAAETRWDEMLRKVR